MPPSLTTTRIYLKTPNLLSPPLDSDKTAILTNQIKCSVEIKMFAA